MLVTAHLGVLRAGRPLHLAAVHGAGLAGVAGPRPAPRAVAPRPRHRLVPGPAPAPGLARHRLGGTVAVVAVPVMIKSLHLRSCSAGGRVEAAPAVVVGVALGGAALAVGRPRVVVVPRPRPRPRPLHRPVPRVLVAAVVAAVAARLVAAARHHHHARLAPAVRRRLGRVGQRLCLQLGHIEGGVAGGGGGGVAGAGGGGRAARGNNVEAVLAPGVTRPGAGRAALLTSCRSPAIRFIQKIFNRKKSIIYPENNSLSNFTEVDREDIEANRRSIKL